VGVLKLGSFFYNFSVASEIQKLTLDLIEPRKVTRAQSIQSPNL
jgi:hypothetical protein